LGIRRSFFFFLLAWPVLAAVTVNDVTQLNPVSVDRVVSPKNLEELVTAVKSHAGAISIAGGRYSQGGQSAFEGSLNLDMTAMNQVLDFRPGQGEITVQAGITWKKIQRHIDSRDLAVKIMQTYSNFTVGGSLSVNVHGRYLGLGPIVSSVRALKLVLADGRVVSASPVENRELFYAAIGGYGGIGVIAEATLLLDANVSLERERVKMPLAQYSEYFFDNIRGKEGIILHNADIYPPDFKRVSAVSWSRSDKAVTEEARLIEQTENSFFRKFLISVIANWPGGKWFRESVVDPWSYSRPAVYRRNYEASYDTVELEPFSRNKKTFVLQEYFVPLLQLDAFAEKMRAVFQENSVNVINVSVRSATRDPGTLLAWAREDVFAFVVYYEQGIKEDSGEWTRKLVEAALELGGSYYLPYQPHATREQFRKAYPRADEFFALKRKYDPTNKFRNRLLEKYR